MSSKVVIWQILLLYAASAYSNFENINLNDVKLQIPEGLLPNEISTHNVSIEDIRKILREKCIKVSGKSEIYDNIELEAMKLGECLTGLVNFTIIDLEIKEASPIGELDTVFNKYCKKTPNVIKCVQDFKNSVNPCLKEEELKHSEVFMKIISSLLKFVCYKGGDQIALFIAEDGPECFQSQQNELGDCLNKTITGYLPKNGLPSLDSLPDFIIGEKECRDIDLLQICVNDSLQKCDDVTPANIVESMFNYIRNETTCKNYKHAAALRSKSSIASTQQFSSIIGTILMAMLAKLLIF